MHIILVTWPLQPILSDERQNSQNFAPCGKIDTTKYFGSCAIEWAVSDLDWISEPTIFNFRIRIGYGVYEKISDPIRLQNFHIRTPLLGDTSYSWLESMTRMESRFLVTRFELRFSQNHSIRVTINDLSQIYFHKISDQWWISPDCYTQTISFFAAVIVKCNTNFLFDCLVQGWRTYLLSRVTLWVTDE